MLDKYKKWECKFIIYLISLCSSHFSFQYARIKSGRVVIVLAGRYAGRKAVIVKASEDGNDKKRFGHAIGITLP